jgi:hypothetical protein
VSAGVRRALTARARESFFQLAQRGDERGGFLQLRGDIAMPPMMQCRQPWRRH